MTIDGFQRSLAEPTPPAGLQPALLALWWAGRAQGWNRAHEIAQAHEGEAACDLVHAHLHRVEGDLSNAGYWYRRAGRDACRLPIREEWQALATELLAAA